MKFRRKSDAAEAPDPTPEPEPAAAVEADEAGSPTRTEGPFDVSEVDLEGSTRVDLGSLLIAPTEGREVRLQVDEATKAVQAVMVAGPDGALELRAFAAPRNGDLWSEVRPQISADIEGRGGTAAEREGRFGTELVCERPVQQPDGKTGTSGVPDRRRQRPPVVAPGHLDRRAGERPGGQCLLGGHARPGRRPPGRPRDAGRRPAADRAARPTRASCRPAPDAT